MVIATKTKRSGTSNNKTTSRTRVTSAATVLVLITRSQKHVLTICYCYIMIFLVFTLVHQLAEWLIVYPLNDLFIWALIPLSHANQLLDTRDPWNWRPHRTTITIAGIATAPATSVARFAVGHDQANAASDELGNSKIRQGRTACEVEIALKSRFCVANRVTIRLALRKSLL